VFYLREYPKVVGLLHGPLDNPWAWVRKVAINQRGSFLRAYLRQQTRGEHPRCQNSEMALPEADDLLAGLLRVAQAARTVLEVDGAGLTLVHADGPPRRVAATDAAMELLAQVQHPPRRPAGGDPGRLQHPAMSLDPTSRRPQRNSRPWPALRPDRQSPIYYSSRTWHCSIERPGPMSARVVQLGYSSRKARVTAANSGEMARL
jgi:hypothetical protein